MQLHPLARLLEGVQARNPHQSLQWSCSQTWEERARMTPLAVPAAVDTMSHQLTTGSSVSSVGSGFMTVVDLTGGH